MARLGSFALALVTAALPLLPLCAPRAAEPLVFPPEETTSRAALIERILTIYDLELLRRQYIAEQLNGFDLDWYAQLLATHLAVHKVAKEVSPKVTREIAEESRKRYMAAWRKRMEEELPIHDIYFEAYSDAFNRAFTVEELEQVVEFLETPAGTKLLMKMPDLIVRYLDSRVVVVDTFERYTREIMAAEVERITRQVGGN